MARATTRGDGGDGGESAFSICRLRLCLLAARRGRSPRFAPTPVDSAFAQPQLRARLAVRSGPGEPVTTCWRGCRRAEGRPVPIPRRCLSPRPRSGGSLDVLTRASLRSSSSAVLIILPTSALHLQASVSIPLHHVSRVRLPLQGEHHVLLPLTTRPVPSNAHPILCAAAPAHRRLGRRQVVSPPAIRRRHLHRELHLDDRRRLQDPHDRARGQDGQAADCASRGGRCG